MKNKILKTHFTWIVFAFLFASASVSGADIIHAASHGDIEEIEEQLHGAAKKGDIERNRSAP